MYIQFGVLSVYLYACDVWLTCWSSNPKFSVKSANVINLASLASGAIAFFQESTTYFISDSAYSVTHHHFLNYCTLNYHNIAFLHTLFDYMLLKHLYYMVHTYLHDYFLLHNNQHCYSLLHLQCYMYYMLQFLHYHMYILHFFLQLYILLNILMNHRLIVPAHILLCLLNIHSKLIYTCWKITIIH